MIWLQVERGPTSMMSFRKSLAWAYAGQIASNLLTFVGSIIVARLLSPHEMGIYAIAMATFGVFGIVSTFGTYSFIIREAELAEEAVRTAYTINALIEVTLALILIAFSFVAGAFFRDPGAALVLRVAAVGPVLGALTFRAAAMMQRDLDFRRSTIISTLSALIATAITVVSAYLGASYLSPAFGGLASAVTGIVGFTLTRPRDMIPHFSLTNWRPITAFGTRMLSIGGIQTLCERCGEVALGRILGLSALGLYSRASSLDTLIYNQVYGTAGKVLFPQIADEYRRTGKLHDPFVRNLRFLTALIVPMLFGLAVLSRPVIHILYGEKWVQAAAPLSMLMISQAVVMCYAMNWEIFVLKDETKLQARLEVSRSVFGLALFLYAATVSITAAAAARILTASIGLLLYAPYLRRFADLDSREFVRIALEAIGLGVLASGPALLLMLERHWDAGTPLTLMIPAVLLGGLFWLLALFALGHPLSQEVLLIWRRVASRR